MRMQSRNQSLSFLWPQARGLSAASVCLCSRIISVFDGNGTDGSESDKVAIGAYA